MSINSISRKESPSFSSENSSQVSLLTQNPKRERKDSKALICKKRRYLVLKKQVYTPETTPSDKVSYEKKSQLLPIKVKTRSRAYDDSNSVKGTRHGLATRILFGSKTLKFFEPINTFSQWFDTKLMEEASVKKRKVLYILLSGLNGILHLAICGGAALLSLLQIPFHLLKLVFYDSVRYFAFLKAKDYGRQAKDFESEIEFYNCKIKDLKNKKELFRPSGEAEADIDSNIEHFEAKKNKLIQKRDAFSAKANFYARLCGQYDKKTGHHTITYDLVKDLETGKNKAKSRSLVSEIANAGEGFHTMSPSLEALSDLIRCVATPLFLSVVFVLQALKVGLEFLLLIPRLLTLPFTDKFDTFCREKF